MKKISFVLVVTLLFFAGAGVTAADRQTKTTTDVALQQDGESLAGGVIVEKISDRMTFCHVFTPNTSMVISAAKGMSPRFQYYGDRLVDTDLRSIMAAGSPNVRAYPEYGMMCKYEATLSVLHPDGNPTLDMVVDDVAVTEDEDSQTLVVTVKDRVYPFYAELYWKAYKTVDMIEAWTNIINNEDGAVTLLRFDSACLPFHRGAWVSYLSGAWANEANVITEKLEAGIKVINNKDGVRNSHNSHSEVMFGLDGRPQENTGAVIGAALCYSGNYELRIETDLTEYHRFYAGINPDNSQYLLEPGESFETPAVAFTYSDEGLSGASRNFHKWARKYKIANADKERKILLNSWEGVVFEINEPEMENMMSEIASMGGELFVMDDGWFGDKYPRNDDSSSLGDWVVNRAKLPHGIGHLVEFAKGKGIGFGIWIEPESLNLKSELFEQHPDWVIQAPERRITTGRGGSQAVLDMSNPAVQDFVVGVVDNIMTENPEIEYIKWDANCSIWGTGSHYLPANKQSHLNIEFHRGLADVCKRIREKYPDVTMQACASGGGRVSYGIMPWFDEFWTSDNSDALQRVYTQWGTSYFFPAIAMAAHVSPSPHYETHRATTLKFRIDVAMSGRFGLEFQPKDMTDAEKDQCRRAIAEYKEIRPVVQFGDIYRLISPFDGFKVASLMYCSEDKTKAVFFWWKLEHMYNIHLPRVKMQGLDPDKKYTIRELDRIDSQPLPFEGRVYTGRFLMSNGLDIPALHVMEDRKDIPDMASRILYLEAVE